MVLGVTHVVMRLLFLLLTTLLALASGCSLLFEGGDTDGSMTTTIDASPMVVDAYRPGAECDTPWSAWKNLVPLSIGSSTDSLTNFPVLVMIDSSLQTDLDLQAEGRDLRFSDNEGNELDYEIDTWAGNVAYVWVKVPELPGNQATRIWMYGKNSEPGDAPNPEEVWDDGFRGVWHFSDKQEEALFVDSTGKLPPGTPSNVDDSQIASGEIGNSVFAGAQSVPAIEIGTSTALDTPDALTLEARVLLPHVPSGIRVTLRRLDSVILVTQRDSSMFPDLTAFLSGDTAPASVNVVPIHTQYQLSDDEWHYLVGTYDTSTGVGRLYLDGRLAREELTGTPSKLRASSNSFGLGENLRGHMDEARLSGVARSAAWIDAQHRSMSGALVTIGDVITCTE